MKKLRAKIWIQYIIPLTIFSFLFITIEFTVNTDGGYTRLYGFPLPYISETWVMTFHHNIYLGPLLFDLAAYMLIWALIIKVILKAGLSLRTNTTILSLTLIIITGLIFTHFILLSSYNSYLWEYDEGFEIKNTTIRWGFYP